MRSWSLQSYSFLTHAHVACILVVRSAPFFIKVLKLGFIAWLLLLLILFCIKHVQLAVEILDLEAVKEEDSLPKTNHLSKNQISGEGLAMMDKQYYRYAQVASPNALVNLDVDLQWGCFIYLLLDCWAIQRKHLHHCIFKNEAVRSAQVRIQLWISIEHLILILCTFARWLRINVHILIYKKGFCGLWGLGIWGLVIQN